LVKSAAIRAYKSTRNCLLVDISMFSLRSLILLVMAAVGVYLVYLLLSLVRLRGRQSTTSEKPGSPFSPWLGGEVSSTGKPATPPVAEPRAEPQFAGHGDSLTPSNDNDAGGATFSNLLAKSSADGEIRQLRHEVAKLRAELTQVSDELRRIQAPSRNIAPLYSQAMILAQQGTSAEGIASRCGISVGEAELVVALVQSQGDQRGPR
jgi:hypothetical protein